MPKAAHSLNHTEHANDPRDSNGAQAKDTKHKDRKHKDAKHSRAKSELGSPNELAAALAQVKKDARPLLIGAGVGAAVALTVLALQSRRRPPALALFASPNATFLSALVRAAAFTVERTAAQGSFASVAARVVGRAVA